MSPRTAAALVLVALAVPAALTVGDVVVDNRLEKWVGSGPGADRYAEFRAQYGSDEFVVLAVTGAPLFEAGTLASMVAAAEVLEGVPGVTRVRGLPVSFRDVFGSDEIDLLRRDFTSTPFYNGIFIDRDATIAGILLDVDPGPSPDARRRVMTGVGRAAAALEDAGLETAVVGSTALIVALDEISESESRRAFTIALAASLVMVVWLLRSVRSAAIAAVGSGLTVLLTLAAVVAADRSLNMITSVLPALLWVLSLAGAIHVLRRFADHRGRENAATAVAQTLAETTRPLVLAGVTTAAGFASLAAADLQPVRELGVFAAGGILLALLVNLTVVPGLILLLAVRPRDPRRFRAAWRLGLERPRAVVAASIVLIVTCGALLPGVEVASNPLAFLPPGHELVGDYTFVGSRLTGFYTLEVVVDLPLPWTDPRIWPTVGSLADELGASPIVVRVVSALDVLRKLHQWQHELDESEYRLPDSREHARQLVGWLDEAGDVTLDALVAEGGRQLRLSAMVNEMDEGRFLDLVDEAESMIDALPEGYGGFATGQVVRLVEAQQTLVRTQVESLGLALLIVFALIGVGLQSFRLLMLSVLPNLLPIASAFALMAAFGLTLDAATVMVASVALGIAVDDTVHILTAVRDRGDPAEALSRIGPALVVTTLTACAGFLALTVSSFRPIAHFGWLAAAAMAVALFADLLLVPALLLCRRSCAAGSRDVH